MNWKWFLRFTLLIVISGFSGVFLVHISHETGRISACNDMLNVLNMDPMLRVLNFECVRYNGDVALKVGNDYYSLDGTKKLN